jgi:hypothetical protein
LAREGEGKQLRKRVGYGPDLGNQWRLNHGHNGKQRGQTQATYNRFEEANFSGLKKMGRKKQGLKSVVEKVGSKRQGRKGRDEKEGRVCWDVFAK